MAPSHSTPDSVSKTIQQITVLLNSIDNKVLLAYHEYLARVVTREGHSTEEGVHYASVCHLMALKVVQQVERNTRNVRDYYKNRLDVERRTTGDKHT